MCSVCQDSIFIKVKVLHFDVQQSWSYWDRISALSLYGQFCLVAGLASYHRLSPLCGFHSHKLQMLRTYPNIYLFGVLRRFQHYTGHITTGSWNGRGNQYIQFIRVLYCTLPTNSKQLRAFPLEAMPGTEPRPQRWEARVLPLCHRGPNLSQ